MKKGFTMIELIFVIVILGILASAAIPRLAATREDAEITTTVANLRTLISDINTYYVVKGGFDTIPNPANATKWRDITNVPLKNHANAPITDQPVSREVYLWLGGTRCIGFRILDRVRNTTGTVTPTVTDIPAHIEFFTNTRDGSDTCRQVLAAEPIRAFTQSTLRIRITSSTANRTANLPGKMLIGSDITIHE